MRTERVKKKGLVLPIKSIYLVFLFIHFINIFSMMLCTANSPLLCYHMGMETNNFSILFSLSSLFSPLMLNLTSEEKKKKRYAKKTSI